LHLSTSFTPLWCHFSSEVITKWLVFLSCNLLAFISWWKCCGPACWDYQGN
jgi:hypothetical protein